MTDYYANINFQLLMNLSSWRIPKHFADLRDLSRSHWNAASSSGRSLWLGVTQ